jgi:ATP-dependent Clp protease adaptor protein ClpS
MGSGQYVKGSGTGGGNHRLLLMHAETHTEKKVVMAVTTVVPGISAKQAANSYHTAKQLGMAMITTCLKEHAEFYAQQLFARGCRCKIEPDTTTL